MDGVPSSGWPRGPARATTGRWGRVGDEGSPTADTGHSLVQLTQSGGYISRPCSPRPSLHSQGKHSPTHRDRGMDKMAQGQGAGRDRQARRRKRRGWAAVSSWSGLLRFHLTRQVGGRQRHTNELQAPDRRLPRAHANSATWSSANTGRPRRHGTQNTEWGTRLG